MKADILVCAVNCKIIGRYEMSSKFDALEEIALQVAKGNHRGVVVLSTGKRI
jgi:hypothetical protein